MFRFAIAAFLIGVLVACSGAPATPAPTVDTTAAPAADPTQAPTASMAPTPRPTPPPTASPTASPEPTQDASLLADGPLQPGRYFGEFEGYRFAVTVPDAGWTWTTEFAAFHQGDDSELAIFWPNGDITSLFAEACESAGTEFEFGPTVDDLANALMTLEDFEVTEAADVTLSGYDGKRVAVTVPADVDVSSTDCDGGAYSLSPARHYQAAGQTDDMWILDVHGQRQIPAVSTTPDTPAVVVGQLEEMVDSLVLEPI